MSAERSWHESVFLNYEFLRTFFEIFPTLGPAGPKIHVNFSSMAGPFHIYIYIYINPDQVQKCPKNVPRADFGSPIPKFLKFPLLAVFKYRDNAQKPGNPDYILPRLGQDTEYQDLNIWGQVGITNLVEEFLPCSWKTSEHFSAKKNQEELTDKLLQGTQGQLKGPTPLHKSGPFKGPQKHLCVNGPSHVLFLAVSQLPSMRLAFS